MKKLLLIISTFILAHGILYSQEEAQRYPNLYNIECDFSECYVLNIPETIFGTYDPFWTEFKKSMPIYLAYGCNRHAHKDTSDIILAKDASLEKTLKLKVLSIESDGNMYVSFKTIDSRGNVLYEHDGTIKGDGEDNINDACKIMKPSMQNDFCNNLYNALCDIGDELRDVLFKRNKKKM